MTPYLVQVVAACCILHNVCEVHNDGFDETWEVVSTAGGAVSASGSAQVSQTLSSPRAVAIREAPITLKLIELMNSSTKLLCV